MQTNTAFVASRRQVLQGGVLLAAAALVAGLPLASAGATESAKPAQTALADGPITIVDQLGKTIEFDEVPTRVASTIMPFPSIYFAFMGNTDTLVGCNPNCMPAYEKSALKFLYPAMAQTGTEWCGSDFSVNIEELLKLKPDVVFQWTSHPESIEAMEAAGLKVVALQYGGIEDLKTWLAMLGDLFQKQDRAEFLIDYFDGQIAEVDEVLADLPEDKRPVCLHLSGDLEVYTPESFSQYWIEHAGAKNPVDGSGTSVEVDMEQIYSWNPAFVFIGNFTDMQPSDLLENKIAGQDWSPVNAVQDANVYKIPIGGYRWDPPSVETPLMVKWLASTMHPELFADLDMAQELERFYADVYGTELTDEQIDSILGHTQE